jgi:hypothetical protein
MADLITLSTYKTATEITGSAHDAKLNLVIANVSQLVKTYCNNSFVDYVSGAKTETWNIEYNTSFVHLSETPFILATSVKERTSYSGDYTTLTATDYYVDTKTDSVYRVNSDGSYKNWPTGPDAVEIVYRAGAAAAPIDLQLAVIDLVSYYHKGEHKARQTMAGASLQNQSSTSQRNNVAFPDHIKRVLDLYKNY